MQDQYSFIQTLPVSIALIFTDATGRLINHVKGVSTIGANSISVDVSNFSRGTYTVSVINGVGRQSIKFNKQ